LCQRLTLYTNGIPEIDTARVDAAAACSMSCTIASWWIYPSSSSGIHRWAG